MRGNRIPPAALLTLVENAIKHGLSPRPGGGLLRVAAHGTAPGSRWTCPTAASASARPAASAWAWRTCAPDLGLYGGEASLRLTGAEEGGVRATMRLPFGPRLQRRSHEPGGVGAVRWAGWRADVVERLDRRSIGVVAAWVAPPWPCNSRAPAMPTASLHALFMVSWS